MKIFFDKMLLVFLYTGLCVLISSCTLAENMKRNGDESDGWSTIELLQNANKAIKENQEVKAYEYILKSGFRWQYESSCYESIDDDGGVREAIVAHLHTGASHLAKLQRDDIEKYTQVLSNMKDWQLTPVIEDGQSYIPGYQYRLKNDEVCIQQTKQFQESYEQWYKKTYGLLSNSEYQQLIQYVNEYENKDINVQKDEEDKQLEAINRILELELEYEN